MTKRLDRYSAQEIPTSAKFNQMVDAVNANTEALENKANKDEVPDVPDWAMNPVKPSYTASEVGAMPADTKLFSGSYDDLSDKPVIPTLPDNIVTDPNYTHTDNNFTDAEKEKLGKAITEYQKIKTVNGQSLVGEGNIIISGGEGGSYDDTELREIINGKQDTIADLESIRSGAAAGSTALQPVEGKVLSSNDYTDADKQKVQNALTEHQSLADYVKKTDADNAYQQKGNYLTEHQKLKTINGQSIVGEGDIPIYGGLTGEQAAEIAKIADKADKTVSATSLPSDGIPLAGTSYKLGTIAALSINGIPMSDAETVIYFTADEGFTMSIPDCEVVGELSAEAGKSYVMSILNGIVVMGEVTSYNN